MKKMNLFLTAILMGMVVVSCAPKKAVVKEESKPTPGKVKIQRDECEELSLQKAENLRGYGTGTSPNQQFARDQAMVSARNNIASQVSAAIQSMITTYNRQHQNDQTIEYGGRMEQVVRSLVDQTLTGSRPICSNTYQDEKTKYYEVHVCVELTGVDLTKMTYNKLKNDEKVRIDYDYEKYKAEFEKALEAQRNK